MKLLALGGLALMMTGASYAALVQDDNSDYGNQGFDCTDSVHSSKFLCNLTSAPGLFGEQFSASFSSDFHVWDFDVVNNLSNFTLTLTGSLPFIANQTVNGQKVNGFGMFVCSAGETSNPVSGERICTPSGDYSSAVIPSPDNGNSAASTVSFTVPGNGQGFVFFVVSEASIDSTATVTATITSAATVPEPSSWSLVIAGLIAVGFLAKRKLANLI